MAAGILPGMMFPYMGNGDEQGRVLPPEIVSMVWSFVPISQPVTHHLFIVRFNGTSRRRYPRRGDGSRKRGWVYTSKMSRGYVAVDPWTPAITINTIKTANGSPQLRIVPNGSGAMGAGVQSLLLVRKLPFVGAVKSKINVNFGSRFRGVLDYQDDQVPGCIYVRFDRDVFYFHNEFSYSGSPPVPADDQLQFLVNPVRAGMPTSTPNNTPDWVGQVCKLAIRIEDINTINYEVWKWDHEEMLRKFTSLQRLYFVVDCQVDNVQNSCQLTRRLGRYGVIYSDGFWDYWQFVLVHLANEVLHGNPPCGCRLPDIDPAKGVWPTPRPLNRWMWPLRANLQAEVAAGDVLVPLPAPSVRWVVDRL